MDLQNLTLFNMANKKMDWLAHRQAVLAQNIANTDTPKYMPKDLSKIDFSKELASANTENVALKVTNEKHLSANSNARMMPTMTNNQHLKGTLAIRGSNKVEEVRRPYETKLDKNGVVVEEQMAKLGRNAHEYEVSTTIYNKYTSMLRTSLGKNR